jgi:hypothetical protein
MFFRKIFFYLLLLALILLATISTSSILMGYENSIAFFIQIMKFEKYTSQISLLFSEEKFLLLQIFIFTFIFLFIIAMKYNETICNKIIFYKNDFVHSFHDLLINQFNGVNKYILLFPVITYIYFVFTLPISYDEAWTFLNFTERGVISSLAYYPAPNNHILHSLLTNLSYVVFSFNPLLCLRLPTVIVSILIIMSSLLFFKKHYNPKIGILVSGIFPLLFMSLYYGYMSRGYNLVILFFILPLNFVFNIIKKQNQERDWFWFILFSILGFFTMPSYLYVFIILNSILLVNYKKDFFFKHIKSSIAVSIIVVFLYLPVIVVNGLSSLISNTYVKPITRSVVFEELPLFFKNTLVDLFGLGFYSPLIIILLSILFFIKSKNWWHLKLMTIFIALPPILLLMHSVIPFSRTFNYYAFILLFLLFISVADYISKLNIKYILGLVLIIQLLFIYNFNQKIYEHEKYAINSKLITSKIIGNNKSYFVSSGLFETYLLYELKTNHFNNYQLKYLPAIDVNTDTIINVNYSIIDLKADQTEKKAPIYSTKFHNLY